MASPKSSEYDSGRGLAPRDVAGVVLVAMALLGIALGTLFPAPDLSRATAETPPWCLVCGDVGLTDVIQNVFFFVPLGVALALLGFRARQAAFIGVIVSLIVELLQWTVVTGRDASLSDLLTNTVGTALGAAIAGAALDPGFPSPKAAKRLLVGALASLAALWGLSAWLLAPDARPTPWLASLRPTLNDHASFAGTLDSVRIGAVPVSQTTQLPDDMATRYADAQLSAAVALPVPNRSERGAIAVVESRTGTRQMLVAMTASHAAKVTFRIRASQARLQPLRFYAARAFAGPVGSPTVLRFSRDRSEIRVEGTVNGKVYAASQRLGPHWLAALVSPVPGWEGWEWTAIMFVWVAVFLGLAGFAIAASGGLSDTRVPMVGWIGVAATAVWMVAVNLIAGFPPVPLVGWLVCGIGIAIGTLLGRRTMRALH